jgi:ribosomal protein S21
MAKKQTFESKLSKKGSNFKYVKHIKSVVSEDSGFIKFLDNMVRLEENENIDQALKRMEEESKQVLSFGESLEEPKEEAPAEEVKADEAPAEEPKEEAPAEEAETATEDQSAEEAEESSDK